MFKYGQIIDSGFEPEKHSVYQAFTDYFNNPTMTKVKDVDKYSMYITRIHAMLGNAERYLITIVPRDVNNKKHTEKMQSLEWVSLQTRTLEEIHRVPSHIPLDHLLIKKSHLNLRIKKKVYTICRNFLC